MGRRSSCAPSACLRLLAAADDLCDPAKPETRPDHMLQVMRPRLTMDLRDDLTGMAGAPPHAAAPVAGVMDTFMKVHLNNILRDNKLPPISPLNELPELPELQKGAVYYAAGSMRKNFLNIAHNTSKFFIITKAKPQLFMAAEPCLTAMHIL